MPVFVCDTSKAWCSDSDAGSISHCEEGSYPTKLIFDLGNNQARVVMGSGSSMIEGHITAFEVADTGNEIFHFRTDYVRGLTSIGLSRDRTASYSHTTTLVTVDGFARIVGGGYESCKVSPTGARTSKP